MKKHKIMMKMLSYVFSNMRLKYPLRLKVSPVETIKGIELLNLKKKLEI